MSIAAAQSSQLTTLPRPVALHVSDFLEVRDVLNVSKTCRDLNQKVKSHDRAWNQVAQIRSIAMNPRLHPDSNAFGLILEQYRDRFTLLPRPLALNVANYLRVRDVLNVGATCRDLNEKVKSHDRGWNRVAQIQGIEIDQDAPVFQQIVRYHDERRERLATEASREVARQRGRHVGDKYVGLVLFHGMRRPAHILLFGAPYRALCTAENWSQRGLEGAILVSGMAIGAGLDAYYGASLYRRDGARKLFIAAQVACLALGVGIRSEYPITGASYIAGAGYSLIHASLPHPESVFRGYREITSRAFVLHHDVVRTPACRRVTRVFKLAIAPIVSAARFAHNLFEYLKG